MKELTPDPGSMWGLVVGRIGSSRLRGKTMADIGGVPSLVRIIRRLRLVEDLADIVVATTTLAEDDAIVAAARAEDASVFRGSPDDVLGRTHAAARTVGASAVVYITGDCPLVDPAIVSRVIAAYRERRPDLASNKVGGYQFPIGMDVEAISVDALSRVAQTTNSPRDREHVTLWFYEHHHQVDVVNVPPRDHERRPELRLTLDTPDDLRVIRAIYDALEVTNVNFGLDDVLEFIEANPEVATWNNHVAQYVP